MRKNIVLITLALLSVLLIVSCSNKTQESKAVGLSIGRVETVFADDAWNYDVVYKSGSTRYISEVVVNLSNGTYRYPSSVKAEILKKDGETWKSISKDVTDKFTFSDSGVYKIKYTAEGMTAETGEFNVYKPGDIVDFYATKKAYVEGFQMQRKDFSCTYCYKDKNGNIGITNSSDKAWVSYYARSADYTSFFTILNYDGSTQENYQYGEVMAGVVVQIPDTEIYSIQEVPITVVKEESCDSSIKNLAYFTKPNKSADHYEFSGSIIKALYYDGSSVGKIDLVKKTEVGEEVGVKIAEGYTVKISDFIASKAPKSDTAAIQELYDGVTTWHLVDDPKTTFANKSTSEITGAGYYMIQIFKGEKEITKEDPAFIRISK